MLRYFFKFKKIFLTTGDIIIFYSSIFITLLIRYDAIINNSLLKNYFLYFSFFLPISLLIFYINNLYDLKRAKNNTGLYLSVLKSIILNFFIASAYFYFVSSDITPKTILLIFSAVLMVCLFVWRYTYNTLLKMPTLKRNAIIISSNDESVILTKEINNHPEFGYKLIYKLEPENAAKIKKILDNKSIQTIILGTNVYHYPDIVKILYQYRNPNHEFINYNEFYEGIIQKIPLTAINEIWFLENINEQKLLYDFVKKIIDIILSIIISIIFVILLIPIAIIIKLDSPGPIFYRQKRMGKKGREFILIKFRSMFINAEANGAALWTEKNDPRISRFGNFMRKFRIDELPQVINIIKGEMSFIGPRPERPEFQNTLENKIPFFQERNLVKPGLTGWAQTMHRYASSIDDTSEKLQYDLYYIKNRSLSLDLTIIIKTINIILEKKGR